MNFENPKYDLDETDDKIPVDDENAPHSGTQAQKKNSHQRGFSFNMNQQDKSIIPDEEDVLDEGGEATGYQELEQTTQNHLGDQSNNFIKVDD